MKLIESKVELLIQGNGIEGVYKQIELAGRTCYKSEDKITSTSAKEFTDRMIKSGHGAMLEHGTVYLTIAKTAMNIGDPLFYVKNKYSKVNEDEFFYYITTNMRVLVENNKLGDLQYQVEPTEYHEKRITVKFICDRGVSHQKALVTVTIVRINLITSLLLLNLLGQIYLLVIILIGTETGAISII